MIRFLLIATVLLSVASSYFAFKTRGRGLETLDQKKSAEQLAATTKKSLEAEKKEKKDIETKARDLAKKGEEIKEQLDKKTEDLAKALEDSEKEKAKVKEKESELAQVKEAMAKMKSEEPKVTAAEVEAKLADLRGQVEKANQAADEQGKRAEGFAKQLEEIKRKKEEEIKRAVVAKQEAIRTTVGRILAYNEGWNFVVVDIGDKQGVTPDSQLEVVREGKKIAKLQISQVQKTQTTAGVVWDAAGKQGKFEASDTVVFSAASQAAAGIDTAKVP
ncbi:MAG: hypothetical protein RLZZ244_172 [Verrucomicrobiota bacterium]|jgi:myosin heavy subunit